MLEGKLYEERDWTVYSGLLLFLRKGLEVWFLLLRSLSLCFKTISLAAAVETLLFILVNFGL